MIKNVYCPLCKERGYTKKIARVDTDAKGKIYLWCKCCKKEIEINLNEPDRANNK